MKMFVRKDIWNKLLGAVELIVVVQVLIRGLENERRRCRMIEEIICHKFIQKVVGIFENDLLI